MTFLPKLYEYIILEKISYLAKIKKHIWRFCRSPNKYFIFSQRYTGISKKTDLHCHPLSRHGICHGRTDIVRVKFDLPRVKQSFEHTLFVVNSLLVDIFVDFFVQ